MIYELSSFKPFVNFLLESKDQLLEWPYYGEFWKIYLLFEKFCNPEECVPTQEEFESYLLQFNEISGSALEFDKGVSGVGTRRLKWISVDSLAILERKLNNEKESDVDATTSSKSSLAPLPLPLPSPSPSFMNSQTLLNFLNMENPRNVNLDKANFLTLNLVLRFLERPTARTILGERRARLNTTALPFPLVCNDSKHSISLSNIGLNRKDLAGNNSKQLVSESVVHHRIYQSRNSLNIDAYHCSMNKIHFLPIFYNHTDLNLGDCSYLDTCHKMKTCRYLHYYTLNPLVKSMAAATTTKERSSSASSDYTLGECFTESFRPVTQPQWISCDVRFLPFEILGKFAAIISDPAWDIHMSLPYSTCKDDELLALPMDALQDEGIIMLWVTGRSIEIGRRALLKWGYSVSDEMIWIKLNQLKRTIVTGRTGHWLNHSKEHLLVGLKGNPLWLNSKIDTDVVVSNTRETSHKPDEFYEIIERMVGKHARKLEIFGRQHNTRPGWLTIGNQLQGVSLCEPEVKSKYESFMNTHV
ncbi:IME4 [Candida oxycetoniae]|uniref:mRNA m(6)A methyltransferase n=1 Tax=Candida oxycetoniae TaxID=497107 RepID=A0AAI9SZF0_9ASCO|nr:IME4 [Candida oxycetoniae]KAI3405779.2 IME4 [Candida oxycetoniae]